jgi:hypothetical protein
LFLSLDGKPIKNNGITTNNPSEKAEVEYYNHALSSDRPNTLNNPIKIEEIEGKGAYPGKKEMQWERT